MVDASAPPGSILQVGDPARLDAIDDRRLEVRDVVDTLGLKIVTFIIPCCILLLLFDVVDV
jgi:hypothetical protein